MTKGKRELTCAAVYTRVGLDLRLLERGEMVNPNRCVAVTVEKHVGLETADFARNHNSARSFLRS